MAKTIIQSWSFAFASLIAVGCWWALSVLPMASYWYEPKSMFVADTPAGESVLMSVDRTINRPVRGKWLVTLRRKVPGGWSTECTARGENDYIPGATLPDPLTLDWWTNGQCHPGRPGTYFITTTWTFDPEEVPGVRRTKPLVSNHFRIIRISAPDHPPI